jgi:hypothetical protein
MLGTLAFIQVHTKQCQIIPVYQLTNKPSGAEVSKISSMLQKEKNGQTSWLPLVGLTDPGI